MPSYRHFLEMAVHDLFKLSCPARISMLGENASIRRLPDRRGALRAKSLQMLNDFLAISCHEDLALGLQKKFDAFPIISNQTSACAGSLEDARRRRKSVTRHA